MQYKKLKIAAIVSILLTIIVSTAMYKPSNFKSVSAHGKTIECERHHVTVPELRSDKNSREIEVEYVRLKSFSPNPKTPIFFLAGGPGQGATHQAENPNYLHYWSIFLEERDVVLIDQRGIGKLKMWYAELNWPREDILISETSATNHFSKLCQNAAKAFNRRGINLNGYNSKENALDIDAIRKALGYEKIIPFGFSYGTHLGLSYLKYFKERVEKSILVGVEGLDETFKMPLDLDMQFDKINELMKSDSVLTTLIPDLRVLYKRVVESLQKNPIELEIKTPLKLKRKILVGKFGLDYILKRDMGDASDIITFPKLLYSIDQGDYSTLQWFVEKRYKEFLAIPAMMLSMDLASGGSIKRINEIRRQEEKSLFGKVNNFPFLELHKTWPINDLGEKFRSPVKSNVPVLFLSGDLDINTPAYQADSISQSLSNSSHLVVKNAGHEQIMIHKKAPETMNNFLKGQDISEVELSYPSLKFKSVQ